MIERNAQGVWENVTTDQYTQEKETTMAWLEECEGGREFAARYNFAENHFKISEQMEYHNYDVSFTNLETVFYNLRDSGQLVTSAPIAQEDDVQRTKNGVPLTEPQKKWDEYRTFSDSHSMQDIRNRVKVDAGFASFVRKTYEREMEGVGDSYVPSNPHLALQPPPTIAAMKDDYMVEFAKRYHAMSSAEVKSARSKAANPLTAAKFVADTERAIELRLI
jgi:hypothetical protein